MACKARERRLQRLAARHGLRLRKSRVRDPHALGGGYMLVVAETNAVMLGRTAYDYSANLDAIERFLTGK